MSLHVSLIIPIHNAEPFLDRCLRSAAAQTESNLEIICVDDASTDASRDILAGYASKDSRFRVVLRKSNGGESVARNQGVALARGEYLAFLDHDDILAPDACRLLYELAKDYRADIAKGRVEIQEYDGKTHISPLQLHSEISKISKFYFRFHWWSAVYRTKMIQGIIDFKEGQPFGADALFLTKALIVANSIVCTNDIVYTYIRHPDSGDSRILSHDKVSSILKINVQRLLHLQAANIHITDPRGYLIQAWGCFSSGLNIIPRCIDRKSRKECSDYIFTVMSLHKFPDKLKSCVEAAYPRIFSMLYKEDGHNFRNLAVNEPEMFMASRILVEKLRYKLLQNITTNKRLSAEE